MFPPGSEMWPSDYVAREGAPLFERKLEGPTAEVEAIPAGYSCVPQSCLYIAGDYADDPRAIEHLPKVFSSISKRWAADEHVGDLRDGRYSGQLDTWVAPLTTQVSEVGRCTQIRISRAAF